MVKNYFRLTLVYMVSGDHRNHPTNSLSEFLGMRNPAKTTSFSGVSLAGYPALSLNLQSNREL